MPDEKPGEGSLTRPRRRASLLRDMLVTLGLGLLILGVVVGFNLMQGGGGEEEGWRVVPYVGLVPTGPAPRVGEPAPDFELAYFQIPREGEPVVGTVRLSQHRGHIVWLNFWATWCPPCRAEMPDIQQVWEEVKEREVFLLAIDFGESPEVAADYVKSNGFTFPIGLDTKGRISAEYRLAGLPTHVFIDKNGVVREIRVGLLSAEGMRQRLERLKGY